MAVAATSTTVVLLADRVDVRTLSAETRERQVHARDLRLASRRGGRRVGDREPDVDLGERRRERRRDPSGAPRPTRQRSAKSTKRRSRWSKVLAIVGAVLLPIAGLALWSRNQLLNTDHYVQTVKPLASDPAIRRQLADRITEALHNTLDLKDRAADALPERAKFLAGTDRGCGRQPHPPDHAQRPRVRSVQTAVGGHQPRRAQPDRLHHHREERRLRST